MSIRLATAESVTEGHPDKLCDQISDAVLDAYLKEDPFSHVAIETLASKNTLFLAGEVSSKANVDIEKIARETAFEIGFQSEAAGLDAKRCLVLTNIHQQSPDIAQGVELANQKIGAGDQGIMYGFASAESDCLMPLPQVLSTKLCMELGRARKTGKLPWLYPDGKAQVTMDYENGVPAYITSLVVSAHHRADISIEEIRNEIRRNIIAPVIEEKWLRADTKIHINPTGAFSVGGPQADTGVTGRKLMVDSYGGLARHGGGAFSGKDPTKVDRSGAYMARYMAKHVVAAGWAGRCEVSLAYAIGHPEPEAIDVNTFGTSCIPEEQIKEKLCSVFSCSVASILEQLALRKPQYRKIAAYGHFGREDQGFRWEELDRLPALLG